MTLDDTRKNIVVVASLALTIIGVTLTYNEHDGIGVATNMSGATLIGLYLIGRRCNQARASGAGAMSERNAVSSWLALAAIGSVITTAALSSENATTLAGGLSLYLSVVALVAAFGTEYPSPLLDRTLRPAAPKPTVSADRRASTETLVQTLLDELVRNRSKAQVLKDIPILIENIGLAPWTDQVVPTPADLGPVEITRAANGGVTATGPDGMIYQLAMNERQPEIERDFTLARATLGETVHLYRVPAITRVQKVHFEQRRWGPWGRNAPVEPNEHDDTTRVVSFHFTELRTAPPMAA